MIRRVIVLFIFTGVCVNFILFRSVCQKFDGEFYCGVEDSFDAAGLFDEAIEPFEADFAHPFWRAGGFAGEEVEGAADADGYFDVGHFVEVFGDPEFLGGGAEGDEEDFGLGVVYFGYDGLFVFGFW